MRLRDDLALIQTLDFFTPIVDDPFVFGQIAAANALSDVYAMGGTPLCAMNIAGFPSKSMPIEVLREIFRGGLEMLAQADCVLVGGHTVEDPELKYGLSVSGLVHPEHLWTKDGLRAGDQLLFTKALGTGIINTAIKAEMASQHAIDAAIGSMTQLNRRAAECAARFEVHACTDVTGFGLIGHAAEMLPCPSKLDLDFDPLRIPLLPEAIDCCAIGLRPAGLNRNRSFREAMVDILADYPEALLDLLYDPQSSGGLLIAVPEAQAAPLLEALQSEGIATAALIGQVRAGSGRIRLTPL